MTPDANKALIRRYFEAIDTRRDSAVVDELLAPDFVSHNPSPGFGVDREGQKGPSSTSLRQPPMGITSSTT